MTPMGLTFGDYETFQRRKYSRAWMERTLQAAAKLPLNTRDQLRILHFRDCLEAPPIEDPGRLPCAELQKGESGKLSRYDDKLACLLTMIRNLVQRWWVCSKEDPGYVETLLIELDFVIEEWQREIVVGNMETGFSLEIK